MASQPKQDNPSQQPASLEPLGTGRFIFPPEWHPHLATILGFPSRASCLDELWKENCEEIVDLAAAISEFEPVRLHTRPEDVEFAERLVKRKVQEPNKVQIVPVPINHCWVRDTGPVYVHDATGTLDPSQRLAISFEFNEWGNKNGWAGEFGDYRYGNPAMGPERLRENTDFARNVIAADDIAGPVQRVIPRIRAEGGGLLVDGEGTLIVGESYMLCEERNPGQSREDIEEELRRLLGVEKVIWCPGRKDLDITDCHLDAEARFARPGVVVVTRHDEAAGDGWISCAREIKDTLSRETDARGRRFEVHIIDEPGFEALNIQPEDEFVGSYLNGYFCNGGFIVAGFGAAEHDRRALEKWQQLLPERTVRQVPLRTIPLSGGVVHCVTQQIPAPQGGDVKVKNGEDDVFRN